MFTLGPSRDQSPATNNMMFNNPSPNALFSTPSSDSNDAFNNPQQYLGGLPQNPAWSADFNSQFTSPGALNFTPSPVVNGATPATAPRSRGTKPGRSPLHIAPISTKSRVETQINVVMTLEKPPPNTETLHLPLHTIAKSKLLAKEPVDKAKSLELHTMLVCTSAMRTPQLKEKAMQRAAVQNNEEIQRRAEEDRGSPEGVDRNDMKNVDEADRPANGGEVRICNNCIQRERKRAGRKKLKKEEEQQHWERYETERVVVFNSNEYLPFKPYEPGQQPSKDGNAVADDGYTPPEGSVQVTAAMRIACYCRHQSEKDGFQVIFTLKDQRGNVVAQEMSDSILITDDHKTHPQSFPAAMSDQAMYTNGGYGPPGLATSYSMMDMSTHMQPFTTSRSTGNLQGMAYGPQFNQHSHVHQMTPQAFNSQASSATMTPTSLSRPGSPTSAGHAGPNKKRKSSTFHGRVPSGLTMTPRVDTSQPPSSNMPSAMSNMNSPFSPTGNTFGGQPDQSYMTIPNNGPAQFYNNSNPPTPAAEQGGFNFGQMSQIRGREHPQNMAFYSAPGSRAQSRASSPAPPSGPNALATYGRHPQHMHTHQQQQQPNLLPQRQQHPHTQQQMYPHQPVNPPGSSGTDSIPDHHAHPQQPPVLPMIHKVTPPEGPTVGGTDVSIYGSGFTTGMEVMFGEHLATATTCYGDKALLCVSPPSRSGPVAITIVHPNNRSVQSPQQYQSTGSKHVFTYKDFASGDAQMMEMALRYLSERQGLSAQGWQGFAQMSAQNWVQQNVGRAGLPPQQQAQQQQGQPQTQGVQAVGLGLQGQQQQPQQMVGPPAGMGGPCLGGQPQPPTQGQQAQQQGWDGGMM